MFSSKARFCFVHVPRCSGSTVVEVFEPLWDHRLRPGHQSLQEHHKLFPETKDYFSFGIVRNTYDRLVSLCFKKIGCWDRDYFVDEVTTHTGDWTPANILLEGVDCILSVKRDDPNWLMKGVIYRIIPNTGLQWSDFRSELTTRHVNRNRQPGYDPNPRQFLDKSLEMLINRHYTAEIESYQEPRYAITAR